MKNSLRACLDDIHLFICNKFVSFNITLLFEYQVYSRIVKIILCDFE